MLSLTETLKVVLAKSDVLSLTETLKVVLAKSDAISCVINAMKAFLDKEELQRQACASLLKMASTSGKNDFIGAYGNSRIL